MPQFPRFYIANSQTEDVANKPELDIELSFDNDEPGQQKISITDFEFVVEANKNLLKLNNGLIGGGGVFEGIPFRVEVERNGTIERPFIGYLDLSKGAEFGVEGSTISAVDKAGIDFLNDVADGFTFEYLYSIGRITNSDFISVPYVLNSVPNYNNIVIALVTIYTVSEQIAEKINQISMLIAEMTNVFEATAIVRAVIYSVYLALFLVALIKLLKDVITMLIQPVKYHAGMYTIDLLKKGAEFLGMTFRSHIFETGLFVNDFILPEKLNVPNNVDDERILGFTNPNQPDHRGFYKGTFGDLLRAQKTKHNARLVIQGNEIWLLRADETIGTPQYTLPPVKVEKFKINSEEFKAQTYISFQTDLSEANTIIEYKGTAAQIIRAPIVVNYPDMVLMKDLQQIDIPFALAKIKKELTIVEKILKIFLDVVDALVNAMITAVNGLIAAYNAIVKVINKVIKALKVVGIDVNWEIKTIPPLEKVDFSGQIENRIGMLILDKDFFNIAKTFLLEKGAEPKYNKPASNNYDVMSAEYIYNNFYLQSSFIPSSNFPNGNQYYIYELEKIHFTFDDFQKVKNNNFILTSAGKKAKVRSLKWNVFNQQATLEVWENKLYTTNIRETIVVPSGL